MIYKCKKSNVDEIFNWYKEFADDKAKELVGKQLQIRGIAYYTPSNANWSYTIGMVKVGNNTYDVVTRFGEILALRLTQIPEYKEEDMKGEK